MIGILTSLLPSAYASAFNFNDYTEEQLEMMDTCPTPPSSRYEFKWNCGRWEYDHGEMRRVFHLNITEHKVYDIGHEQKFNGWSFNNTIPGPTLRMTEGDPVTIYVHNTDDPVFPHSMHMHSIHPSGFDGAGINKENHFIDQGTRGQYLFTAMPGGLYPYHCHIDPVHEHVSRGLYGMMVIDPPQDREKANEIFLMMSSYDVNRDKQNDFYVYNGKIHQFADHPIPIKTGELSRIYIANMAEYQDVLSFHLHGMMFNYWAAGTTNSSVIYTDIITLSQGDRGIIEFTNDFTCCAGSSENRNTFMFHTHQSELADLGMMGFLSVSENIPVVPQ